jgi:hypothetical protein
MLIFIFVLQQFGAVRKNESLPTKNENYLNEVIIIIVIKLSFLYRKKISLRNPFLGAFAELWKATVSLVMTVCPSEWYNSAPTGRIFMKFDIGVYFENLLRKIQVSLKSDKINGYFTWRPMSIYISRWILLRMRNVSGKICRENQNTRFIFNNFFPKIMPFVR